MQASYMYAGVKIFPVKQPDIVLLFLYSNSLLSAVPQAKIQYISMWSINQYRCKRYFSKGICLHYILYGLYDSFFTYESLFQKYFKTSPYLHRKPQLCQHLLWTHFPRGSGQD